MLYDPKWETKTKPDIYALSTLIAWLEKQPPEMAYDYDNCQGECLLGQYMAAHGVDWYGSLDGRDPYSAICRATDWGGTIACYGGHTYGAALARARAALAPAEEEDRK